ncbi:MAG: hypothetical protein IJG06_01605, partial [Clostridia bacterium]|nr:hypothetical protein [Clostridia bacterium]
AGTAYTFKGNKVITDGSPNDITNVELTTDLTVTTSGNMNRKYVGITDLKHNNEVGTFPANDKFKATGSYLYMATANANDGAVIMLQIPEIKKGSKVTLTFAKPTVTNNGSTLRNTNDPYAYLKIADRYISINDDNFDTWRTESVVTGEDTSEIVFYADKWGAVAISKIEITEGDTTPLHSVNIASTQYANLNVNGIKFCADEKGKITLPSYEKGEELKITAYKDGYETKEMTQTVADKDIDISIPLDTTVDAAYYESDFGNPDGTIDLENRYYFGDGVNNPGIIKLFGRVTFKEGGYIDVDMDSVTISEMTYDGKAIYIDGQQVTTKDNMEFALYFDNINDIAFLEQNGEYTVIDKPYTDFDSIKSLLGHSVNIEYIGITYPDKNKITIDGPDNVSSLAVGDAKYVYTVKPEYVLPDAEAKLWPANLDNAYTNQSTQFGYELNIHKGANGEVVLNAEYNGAKASKTVKITPAKISEYNVYEKIVTKHLPAIFRLRDAKDEYGNELNTRKIELKDFKSSDESIIKIDQNGIMTAVGEGTATITANAYTGVDNIISAESTSGDLCIVCITDSNTSYTTADITKCDEYSVFYFDGTEEKVEKKQIPAMTVNSDGCVVTAYYDADGKLTYVRNDTVKKGDKIPVTNGAKQVYLSTGDEITKLTEADTTMEGFELTHAAGVGYIAFPIYKITDIGDVAEGKTLDVTLPAGYYDIGFKKGEPKRGDIFVNGFMAANNVDQCDADRKLTEGSYYVAEDVLIKDGKLTVSMTDGSTLLDYVTIKPSLTRKRRVYIIGDSLVCNYYGEFEQEVGGGRTGWGQVIGDYINANIVNLANSGQFAKGLYDTAFPSVIENGRFGDICLIECGYNDRSYSTRDEMISTVKAMVNECREKGIAPILITPNASAHDYKPSVSWSSYLKDAAVDMNCPLIDLSQLSYDFLYSLYGDDKDGNIVKNYNLT